jgi:hypothetical protein
MKLLKIVMTLSKKYLEIKMYSQRIYFLEDSLRLIEERITKDPNASVKELNEEKYKYQTELSKLRRLQWEHDHESVDLDDDR